MMHSPPSSELSRRAKRTTLICLMAILCQPAFAQELPVGWRRTTAAESSGEWRQKSRTRFLAARGDFDGDGKLDNAELLVNTSLNQVQLFVHLTSTGKWQSVGEPFDLKSLDRFGIDLVKPGKYKTACGKGYGDYACAHQEPDFLKLSRPAIDFFYTESSDSIFYLDTDKKTFREILMSD